MHLRLESLNSVWHVRQLETQAGVNIAILSLKSIGKADSLKTAAVLKQNSIFGKLKIFS